MPRRRKNRKRNRLKGFDYSSDRFYFVTICTHQRINYFGGIHNEIMCVNRFGSIVLRQWEWLETQYPYVKSWGFIVMPNHVHGILEINRNYIHNPCRDRSRSVDEPCRDRSRPVPTTETKIKSLSELIGAFKTTSSKLIHKSGFNHFQWQRSFHDHIIRKQKIFNYIYLYVINNPALWNRDRNNPQHKTKN